MFLEIPTYLRKQKFDRQIKALHIYEMKCEVFFRTCKQDGLSTNSKYIYLLKC